MAGPSGQVSKANELEVRPLTESNSTPSLNGSFRDNYLAQQNSLDSYSQLKALGEGILTLSDGIQGRISTNPDGSRLLLIDGASKISITVGSDNSMRGVAMTAGGKVLELSQSEIRQKIESIRSENNLVRK